MDNYYQILRVHTNASQEQIKKAYLELISKYHPDIYNGDKTYAERYTSIITEAYSVLKDPDRRHDYDVKNSIAPNKNVFNRLKESFEISKLKKQERKMSNKNYEQEISKKYFKNSERKKEKNWLLKILTSKLFYCLLFVVGIEALIIFLIYTR